MELSGTFTKCLSNSFHKMHANLSDFISFGRVT